MKVQIGERQVLVETDCKEAFSLVQQGAQMEGISHLVPHLTEMISRSWSLSFSHVARNDEDGVVSVFENIKRRLLTTRSWDFLGMPLSTKRRNVIVESDIIVGVMDTGIWSGCPSFDDSGYGPPPAKWKGKCDKGANFTGCNNKVIGARYYQLDSTDPIPEDPTPVDTDAMAPTLPPLLPGYLGGCGDIDLLAAMDDAINDGVDLISMSLWGDSREFFHDSIAIGAFHAMRKGILTSCSGGNEG
ncbi:hypothetical protein F3Y22_tig00002840pilonHSYRG00245 [Hibiscus syriacus]|uniref:RNase H type-1 domain-containing protein n=1 Tax=Hibiscus syriacus TaxID=106335 RepID=A0A6A3CNQ0_HIBSY|nr:hypothetical protein F3Y22_tig00002840pilonHSYRG00245 [Hibiscus syriacus]